MLPDVNFVVLRLVENDVRAELRGLVPKIIVEFALDVPEEFAAGGRLGIVGVPDLRTLGRQRCAALTEKQDEEKAHSPEASDRGQQIAAPGGGAKLRPLQPVVRLRLAASTWFSLLRESSDVHA